MVPSELRIQEEEDRGRVVLAVAGEIDMATVGRLREALERNAGAGEVWVDLTGVVFMDSTGLNALLDAQQAMEGGRLTVIAPGGPARRALDVSGLHELIRIRDSRAAL